MNIHSVPIDREHFRNQQSIKTSKLIKLGIIEITKLSTNMLRLMNKVEKLNLRETNQSCLKMVQEFYYQIKGDQSHLEQKQKASKE